MYDVVPEEEVHERVDVDGAVGQDGDVVSESPHVLVGGALDERVRAGVEVLCRKLLMKGSIVRVTTIKIQRAISKK